MTDGPLVSLLINNYNYAAYVEACIESALAQTYGNCEIIVVDDGSTDESLSLIKKYYDRLTVIEKFNGGQGSAYNTGFARATGEIVIFLDSDDLLLPNAVEVIVTSWKAGACKAQFKMQMIDFAGRDLPGVTPNHLASGDVTDAINKFGAYASSPGSGNAYSAEILRKILPMDENEWKIAADAYLIVVCPFYGDVIALEPILGKYRIGRKKGGNDSALVFNNSPATPWQTYKRAVDSLRLIEAALKERHFISRTHRFQTSPAIEKLRLISLKFNRVNHALIGDDYLSCLKANIIAISFSSFGIKKKLTAVAWCIMIVMLPHTIARKLVAVTVNPYARRDLLKRIDSLRFWKRGAV